MEPGLLLPPSAAGDLFGDRLDLAQRYVQHLATTGVEWGLIGPREVPRLWDRHVLNCAVLQELIEPDVQVADVGSGAGLPGLVLALCRPDLRLVLVEPLLRRVEWLTRVTDDLQLGNVEVRRGRAEVLAGSVQVPVVTARAVAPLDRLVRWGLPLLQPGGQLLAIKGRTAAEELERTAPAVRRAGGVDSQILEVGAGVLGEPVTVVRVRSAMASTRRTTSAKARRRGTVPPPA
ncbi:MAG TPA: 16S rRNA (guanine(527)-N(7))-methyltransferase RsmG [Actinomycetales bacterium]